MYRDLREVYWWPGMKRGIAQYVAHCDTCQRIKAEHQRPAGLMQPLEIPEWKWDHITMDFIVGLPRTPTKKDSIWVVVDRLTKSAHFLPVRVGQGTEELARLYVREIVRLHGAPASIVSDRDPKFVSRFWRCLQEELGTKLNFSTAYHPQTDGQTERVNQILEDMLRICVLEFGGEWDKYIPLVEFAYNNSFQSSIGMAPYEALYGRRCRTPLCWLEVGERRLSKAEIIQQASKKIELAQKSMKIAQDRQKYYADHRSRKLEFQEGDLVYLRISPLRPAMRNRRLGKLSPRYVGPCKVMERVGAVAYRITLSRALAGLHDVFHVS